MMRRATLVICAVDFAIWALVAIALFWSGSDPATRDLDILAGIGVTILIALTALPAFLLVRAGRLPNLALGFALAFPLAFLVLFVAGAVLVV